MDPRRLDRIVRDIAAIVKLGSLVPGTRLHAAPANLCKLGARATSPRALLLGVFDRMATVSQLYLRVHRDGIEPVLPRLRLGPGSAENLTQTLERYGAILVVTPHCAGSVLGGARLGRDFPARFLVREPKSARRRDMQTEMMAKLEMELLLVRRNSPTHLTRSILGALKDNAIVIGTTDTARPTAGRIPVPMFGVDVHLPVWPARFAARRNVPIVPAYSRVEDGAVITDFLDPIPVTDEQDGTAAWAAVFEQRILACPSDWVFQLDKRWARNLERAVQARRATRSPRGGR